MLWQPQIGFVLAKMCVDGLGVKLGSFCQNSPALFCVTQLPAVQLSIMRGLKAHETAVGAW